MIGTACWRSIGVQEGSAREGFEGNTLIDWPGSNCTCTSMRAHCTPVKTHDVPWATGTLGAFSYEENVPSREICAAQQMSYPAEATTPDTSFSHAATL